MKHFEPGNPKPEIIIGLAGPVGTDLVAVVTNLIEELRAYRYQAVPIRVSDLLQEWCDDAVKAEIAVAKEDKRIDYLMNAADLLRITLGTGAALMPLVTTAIRSERQRFLFDEGCHEDFDEVELYNHCFIINSLKHPDEVKVLRRIYGPKFIMVSAFSPAEDRRDNLCKLIARSHRTTKHSTYVDEANALIDKDRKRGDSDIGQNLSGTFHLADFFLRVNKDSATEVKRFLEIVFGHPNATPTRNEFLMFEARANALRSADLSRQVGAVIANAKLEVVSRGCNEVPVPGGDVHWSGETTSDTRDYASGKDYNAIKKEEILKELVEYLVEFDILRVGPDASADTITNDLVYGQHKGAFRDLRISNLIEFGRMVHAEMFALMEAARRGLSVENGVLYCTTFPCHMCARHIIASGIRQVIYIEPYPKSMTEELYGDMISIDVDPSTIPPPSSDDPKCVYFQPFEGVAPRVYAEAFIMPNRKTEQGYKAEWAREKAKPKWIPLSKSHLEIEAAFAHTLGKIPLVSNLVGVRGGSR